MLSIGTSGGVGLIGIDVRVNDLLWAGLQARSLSKKSFMTKFDEIF